MKRFISFVILASTFFVAAGVLVNRAGATFRSDDKALAILARARTAIGGDNVKSLAIVAKSSKSLPLPDGTKTIDGDLNIAIELPNRMQKTLKAGDGSGSADHLVVIGRTVTGDASMLPPVPPVPAAPGATTVVVTKDGKVEVDGNAMTFRSDGPDGETVTTDGNGNKTIVLKRSAQADANGNFVVVGGSPENPGDPNAKKIVINRSEQRMVGGAPHGNELLRLTLALLARTPEGSDVAFTYAGESSVDGAACDLVTAATGDNGGITLCFDRGTGLPSSMTYKAPKPLVIRMKKADTPGAEAEQFKVLAAKAELGELAEYQVKFADYRTVDGVRLPFSWTQTTGGQADETTTVTEFAVNPPDIASKFKEEGPQKVVLVTKTKY